MVVYLDTSAAAKMLTEEAGEPAISQYLNARAANEDVIVSSTLLETELRRAAALGASADVLVSYDQRQLDAAELVGLHVHSPA